MYLGTIYLSTKFQPDQTSNMAARWPSWGKKQSAITPELMAGSAPNFYHRYNTQILYLTYGTFEGHRGQGSKCHH
jgi:hypothetical protein